MIRSAVTLALAAATFSAQAAQIEVGAGVAQARTNGNGTWYQEGFQHHLHLRSPVLMLGVTGKLTPHITWHVDAVDLGSYSVNSWDTPNDKNYSGHGYRGNALPLANYIGSGSVYGIAAMLQAHTSGAWRFGVQAGPFVYHERWSMQVPDWYPSQEGGPGEYFYPSGPITPLSASQSQWALGYVAGVTLTHGNFSLALDYFSDGKVFPGHGTDPWPPLWTGQTALVATYTFD
jgi:hypothetical protein